MGKKLLLFVAAPLAFLVGIAVAVLVVVGSASDASCGAPSGGASQVDIRALTYPAPSGQQPVDVSIPAGATTPGSPPRPVITVFHGGGWYFSDRHEMEPMVALMAEHGYVVANFDYSYGEPRFPGELNDVSAAVNWARSQASSWGGDPNRVVTMGSSAGANLALQVAMTASGGPVQATIGWSSPTDLNGIFTQVAGNPALIAAGGFDAAVYLGLPTTPEKLAAASPIANIGPRAPPTYLAKSEGDFVPTAQQDTMADALRAHNVPVQTLVVPGAGHAQAITDTALTPTLTWLDSTLGFSTPPPPAAAATPSGDGATLASAPVGGAGLTPNQLANAAAIVGAGKGMGATEQDIIVALATSSQESTRFLNYANDGTSPDLEPDQKDVGRSLQLPHDAVAHDHGSLGIFQQQYPWWGSIEELMTPAIAAQKFFAKEMVVPGRETMAVTVLAQTVQQSGAPDAYADDEALARSLYPQLKDTPAIPPSVKVGDATGGAAAPVGCSGGTGAAGGANGPIGVVVNGVQVQLPAQAGVSGTLTFPDEASAKAASAALSYLGTPYSWGGGGPGGPTVGIHDGGVADSFGDYQHVGFDCSGLTEYAYAAAGIEVGGDTGSQYEGGQAGPHFPYDQALPGDLLFYGSPTHHTALYLGQVGGRQLMVEAPQSGDVVKVSTVRTDELVGVARPTAKAGRQ